MLYTLKVSYGDVDEPEMATTELLGTYRSLDEACEEAKSKFDAIRACIGDDSDICVGEVEGSRYDYYVTYGHRDGELCRLFDGYDHFYYVSVIERREWWK